MSVTVAVSAAVVVAAMVAVVAHVLAASSIMPCLGGGVMVGALHQNQHCIDSSLVSLGGGWWWEHCISDFVADVLATSSLVSVGGGSLAAAVVAIVEAVVAAMVAAVVPAVVASVLACSGGNYGSSGGSSGSSSGSSSDMLQEATAWLSERFARLEVIAEHTEELLTAALGLVHTELLEIRAARNELQI